MSGKHRKGLGVGDIVLYGALLALVLTILAFVAGVAGSIL